jgi:hypothetical protein
MSLGKVVIASANVTTMKVGASGFEVTSQTGMFHSPNGAVMPVKFGVETGKPWPVGEYDLSGDSLHVDKYGRLELRPVLVLIPVAKSAVERLSKAS